MLWSPNGKPYEGAVILVNQKVVTKTGSDGVFHLDSMKAGMYKLLVQGCKYNLLSWKMLVKIL